MKKWLLILAVGASSRLSPFPGCCNQTAIPWCVEEWQPENGYPPVPNPIAQKKCFTSQNCTESEFCEATGYEEKIEPPPTTPPPKADSKSETAAWWKVIPLGAVGVSILSGIACVYHHCKRGEKHTIRDIMKGFAWSGFGGGAGGIIGYFIANVSTSDSNVQKYIIDGSGVLGSVASATAFLIYHKRHESGRRGARRDENELLINGDGDVLEFS